MRAALFVVAVCLAMIPGSSAGSNTASAEPGGRVAGPRRLEGLDLYRPAPSSNPGPPAVVALGRRLFRDRRLSRTGSMACSDCHEPRRAYTNGRASAVGVAGTHGTRNVPTLVNRAWGKSYFWDGRAATLEDQVLQPILDPNELGMTAEAVVHVANAPAYRARLQSAFAADAGAGLTTTSRATVGTTPSPLGLILAASPLVAAYQIDDPYRGLTPPDARALRMVAFALAAYVRTIQSGASPFDRYSRGDRSALDAAAVRGLALFQGRAGCIGCHSGPLLSDERFHNTGIAWRTGALTDIGRARITGLTTDLGAFKTPTLREVARTAPYMHDGSFDTLEAVVDYYDTGGAPNAARDVRLRRLDLTTGEKRDLVAFLRSLNGVIRETD